MPATKRVGDLEVNQDLAYQRREWLFERIGWIIMALLILAGLLGLFGQGWLSSTGATDPAGAVHLRYDRFLHFDEPTQLVLTIPRAAVAGGRCRVWMDRDYLAQVQIQTITPQPQRQELGADRHWFVFEIAEPGERVQVVFWLTPAVRGSLSGRLGVATAGAAEVAAAAAPESDLSFGHFVYP
jgi:hypothetical protein